MFIDRSFKYKTRKFAVFVVFLISAGPMTAECETVAFKITSFSLKVSAVSFGE